MNKLSVVIAALILTLASAYSANISSAGVDGPDGGLLQINQTDPYWWFCVQPDSSADPLAGGPKGYEGDVVTLEYGWTRQTAERFAFAGNATPEAQADLAQQVNVIEYVLDTYLPWGATTDRFLENVDTPPGSTDQTADTDFFNNFHAIQQYVKMLYAKLYEDDFAFTDLSVYSPTSEISNETAADVARNQFFDTITADVNDLAGVGFFNKYNAMHQYAFVNTFYSETDPLDYKDALIIGAVPEPSTVLLAVGSVLLLSTPRRRAGSNPHFLASPPVLCRGGFPGRG